MLLRSGLVLLIIALAGMAVADEFKYVVRAGDTLEIVVGGNYGSRSYMDFIASYNGLANVSSIREGDVLLLPQLRTVVEHLASDAGHRRTALSLALDAYEKYDGLSGALWDASQAVSIEGVADGDDVYLPIGQGVKQELAAVKKCLRDLESELNRLASAHGESWSSTIGQVRKAGAIIDKLESGRRDRNGYDLDMVHQRLHLAIRYLLV